MDRSMKAFDTVTVHASDKNGPVLTTLNQPPYSFRGYDHYMLSSVMYKGFVREDGSAYILLTEPLMKRRP